MEQCSLEGCTNPVKRKRSKYCCHAHAVKANRTKYPDFGNIPLFRKRKETQYQGTDNGKELI